MGFTFNGVHSDSLGFVYQTKKMPYVAPKRSSVVTIPGRNGQVVFEDGYDNIIIELACKLPGEDIYGRRKAAREIASFLSQTGILIFDYEPDMQYQVVKSGSDISSVFGDRTHIEDFTITFECEPYQTNTFYNDDLGDAWDAAEISWDEARYPWDGTGVTRIFSNMTSGKTMTLYNAGTFDALPVIKLEGVATSLSFGGMTFTNLNGTVYIDTKNQLAYSLSGSAKVNKISNFSGNFPKIGVGFTTFTVSGTISSLKVTFDYKNTYL
ncbi:MAG: phage tail family protein [Alphaproteobacteria bacterium]|nr:phage tail family protein [Alphaproteobacteria bacterium]